MATPITDNAFTLETLNELLAPSTNGSKTKRKERTVLHTAAILRRFVASGEVYHVVPTSLYPSAPTTETLRKAFEYQANATDFDPELDADTLRIENAGANINCIAKGDEVWLINMPLFEAWKAAQA